MLEYVRHSESLNYVCVCVCVCVCVSVETNVYQTNVVHFKHK